MTKAAIVGMTRSLAIEVAEQGIRVNSVCPAGMLTNYGDLSPDSAAQGPDPGRHGQGRIRWAERSIRRTRQAAAMFLASDLSSNITGVNLPVDGGLTAGRKVGG